MGYAVELSFNAKKTFGILKKQQDIAVKAREFGCSSQYNMMELEGYGRKITKSESIHVVIYDDENVSSMYGFIREIKKLKIAFIECIYRDDCTCDLLYASGHYLKKLDKPTSLKIRRSMKSPSDQVAENIIKIINNK
uniref:Uncharacterized protein n=1 Tax=viral metagenome TaxID=1070528 RepID=A0A6C0CPM9_9ZZZZ